MNAHESLLDRLRIDSPCGEDWAAMLGGDRSRFCQSCSKHVHDLSAMGRSEAERLLEAEEESICVRVTQDEEGRYQSRVPDPLPAKTRGFLARSPFGQLLLRAASFLLLGGLLSSCKEAVFSSSGQNTPPEPPEDERILMGEVCVPEPPLDEEPQVVMGRIAPPPEE